MEHFYSTPIQTFKPIGGIMQEKVCKEKGLKVDDKIATSSAYTSISSEEQRPIQLCYSSATPSPIQLFPNRLSQLRNPLITPNPFPTKTATSTQLPALLAPTLSPLPFSSLLASPTP